MRLRYHGNIRFLLGVYLLLGLVALLTAVFFFTNQITSRVEEEARGSTEIFSRVVAEILLDPDDTSTGILEEIATDFGVPLIISTTGGIPLLWNGIGIPQDYTFEELLRIDPNDPPPGAVAEVIERMKVFDRHNEPIPFRRPGETAVQGYVHFGSSGLSRKIRVLSYVQFLTVIAYMGVALVAFRYLKRSEARSIWAGMAKETAHQLGTPISSLMGWVARLGDLVERGPPQGAPAKGRAGEGEDDAVVRSIREMRKDVARLEKISARFSQIGAVPRREPCDLGDIVRDTVEYFERRLPNLGARVRLETRLEKVPPVRVNRELIEWVLENLIKNALDSMEGRTGTIMLQTHADSAARRAEILVRDTGSGMSLSTQRRVFVPGYSTKKRGWGLGLPLSKRIVEEYHEGSLRVVESREGRGSTFGVFLPLDGE
jgi:NtrC-family two-component system sensor histidine kinase KinB